MRLHRESRAQESRPLWLIVVVSAALLIEMVGGLGWWRWTRLQQTLATTPDRGAKQIAGDIWWLTTPAVIEHSRRLISSDLEGAPLDLVPAALQQLGQRQARWFPASSTGFKNQAQSLVLADDLQGGIELIEQAVQRDPTSPYLHRFLAVVLRLSGYPKEFLEEIALSRALDHQQSRSAIEMTPEDAHWVRFEALRRRVELYPRKQVQTRLDLAAALREDDRAEEAIQALVPVEEAPQVRLAKATWHLSAGDAAAARAEVEEIATRRTYPTRMRATAWSILARALDLEEDQEGAVAAATRAVELAPQSPAPFIALAHLAERRGDDETALEHFRHAWGMALTDIGILLEVARLAEKTGKPADARLALERASRLAPDRADLVARLIDFYIRNHQLVEATSELAEALDRFPTNPELLRMTERLIHAN
jgi:tetratricopeptide (TPR) repeat protein